MKKLLLLALSLACVSLEAAHFQSSMSVSSTSNKNEFLVEMQIEKLCDGCSIPELIASPKIICSPGEPAQVTIGSEDQADFLSIQVMIPKNTSQTGVQASILMKENNQVVLSLNNDIKVNN
jgi:hypothetical protein